MTTQKFKGHWIPVEGTQSEITANGIPRTGDLVRITYDRDYLPSSGTASIIRTQQNLQDLYTCKEMGADYIFSAKFGI